MGQWVCEVLQTAGIDIRKNTAHSMKSAPVSTAQSKYVPVYVILQMAGWVSERTFAQFCKKTLKNPVSFADIILSQ